MTDLLNDRLPPQNIEAEQAVLGAVFLEPSALTLASEVLIPDDFYRMSHQKIFNAMLVLGDRGEPVDLVTVTSEPCEHGPFGRGWRHFLFDGYCKFCADCG